MYLSLRYLLYSQNSHYNKLVYLYYSCIAVKIIKNKIRTNVTKVQ